MQLLRQRIAHGLSLVLVVAGAVNWGLVGLLRLNLVSRLVGKSQVAERAVYSAVGLAGIWLGMERLLPRLLLALGIRNEDPLQGLANRLLVGNTMPSVTGTTLSGKTITIPRDTLGKLAFLAMGFSYDSRFKVEDWLWAFEGRFGQDKDVVFYEMAMIDSPYRLFGAAIDEGMRRGSPATTHDQVITVYASQVPLRQTLRAASTNDTWVYLLDPSGRVLFQCGGPFDTERFQELTWVADAALARAKAPQEDIAANWWPPGL